MTRESNKKLEEDARNKYYQDLAEMVAEGKPDPEEEMQKAQEQKHSEMIKKAEQEKKK